MISYAPPQDPLLAIASEIASEARKLGCDEAEIRIVDRELDWLTVRNKKLESRTFLQDEGVGVRVRFKGAPGYAASSDRSPESIRNALQDALAIARSVQDTTYAAPRHAEPTIEKGTYRSPTPGGDAFALPLESRIARLHDLSSTLGTSSDIVVASATQVLLRRRTRLASMHGTLIDQTISLHGGGIQAIAQENGQLQQRSFPKAFEGNLLQGGEEVFKRLALAQNAERVREEAIALCHAPACPETRTNLILDGSQLSLHIHETCGHPTEADRALREELSLAGSSFLSPKLLGTRYQYGSPIVNLVADATTPNGAGTFGWDDEGSRANQIDLIRKGEFVGFLNNRSTSERIDCEPISACRAESWDAEPIVRMVNINLEPGSSGSLEDLIKNTDEGILMSGNRSWSIDDHRLNFQFGCEAAYEIKAGKRGQLLRNPVYTGITPSFWKGCDAICDSSAWEMWGYLFCGKGDPMQIMHVGHGTAPARFADAQVCAS